MKHNNEDTPVIVYSLLSDQQMGQCDCDCACSLDLPSVLATQFALDSHDCDCACACDALHGSGAVADHIRFKSAEMLSLPLEGGWQVNFNPLGPVGITVLNPPAQRVLAAFETPITPQQAVSRLAGMSPSVAGQAVDTLLQAGLLRPVEGAAPLPGRPAVLVAWLHITQACNLNCAYCYVQKRPATMSAEVGCSAVDRLAEIAAHHGYTTLKLKYAGGEPTLNLPLIQTIHARAVRRAEQAGLALEEVILTNGVGVADGLLDWLVQAGMRLMVSLDGGAEAHDRLRARRDGTGTYAAVVDTVDRALARGLRPNISITCTALNVDGIQGAVAFALERDLPFNINFYRECSPAGPADARGDKGAASPLVPDPALLLATMLQVVSLIRTYPAYPLPLSNILDRTRLDAPHHYPCSAGRDYLAIDTDGRIAACQMLLEEPWSDLSQEDPLAALQSRGQDVFHAVEEYATCRDCMWHTACSGGCPLLHETVLHDHYCQVYQALFPELVRLEGNRLLACHA
jgi:uncharacterized protein